LAGKYRVHALTPYGTLTTKKIVNVEFKPYTEAQEVDLFIPKEAQVKGGEEEENEGEEGDNSLEEFISNYLRYH
jgi:hypothetical protein